MKEQRIYMVPQLVQLPLKYMIASYLFLILNDGKRTAIFGLTVLLVMIAVVIGYQKDDNTYIIDILLIMSLYYGIFLRSYWNKAENKILALFITALESYEFYALDRRLVVTRSTYQIYASGVTFYGKDHKLRKIYMEPDLPIDTYKILSSVVEDLQSELAADPCIESIVYSMLRSRNHSRGFLQLLL